MQCIDNIYLTEVNVPSTEDLYKKNKACKNLMWVNGSNGHFSTSMNTILSGINFIGSKELMIIFHQFIEIFEDLTGIPDNNINPIHHGRTITFVI